MALLNILLVDDEAVFADVTAASLREEGHQVSVARDGATAMAIAGELLPDVVLLELRLPDADGYEVARALRRKLPDTTPIIVVTPDERQAIETAFFSELTYAETAARLDEPLGTVKTRVRSALAKLRKALGQQGGGS